MKSILGRGARVRAGVVLFVCSLPLFGLSAVACGGASPGANHGQDDDKFATPTNDEYTEALTNAVIGTPTGVITVGVDGGVGVPVPVDAGSVGTGPASDSGAPDASTTFDDGSAPPPPVEDSGVIESDGGIITSPDGGPSTFGQWHFDDCSP